MHSLGQIAEHNRLAQAQLDRPVLTLCSGRPQPFAEALTRLLGNVTLPLIAENGVWLYQPGANIYEMDPSISLSDRDMIARAQTYIDETFGPLGVVRQPGKSASISLYHPDTAKLRELKPQVEAGFRERGFHLRVSMTWLYVNCDLAHVSKATGVRRLIARAGLDPARCAGIGDTSSDLAIADAVSVFACPANAAPEVRARAAFVASEAEAKGVVEIIRHWS